MSRIDSIDIQNSITSFLDKYSDDGNVNKRAIVKHVKSQCSGATKKLVKKALRKLEKRGRIVRKERSSGRDAYCMRSDVTTIANNAQGGEQQDEATVTEDSEAPLPIAEILRRRETKTAALSTVIRNDDNQQLDEVENEAEDIDEEIRRLEAELNNDQGGSSSDDESFVDDDGDDHNDRTKETGVLCLSAEANDRIASLPSDYLPTNKRRYLKIDSSADNADDRMPRPKKKPARPVVNQGLKAAVKEVLSGYVARSSEKLPFYCRVCAKQYCDDRDFVEHKKTDFHETALDMERRASYCKLCRKQLTSPVQLKEHLNSKPHKERLQLLRNRQQGPKR